MSGWEHDFPQDSMRPNCGILRSRVDLRMTPTSINVFSTVSVERFHPYTQSSSLDSVYPSMY